MSDRIEELETKFSFQEDLLQQLNEIVIGQQKQLDLQAQQLQLLLKHLEELREGLAQGEQRADSERPPHY